MAAQIICDNKSARRLIGSHFISIDEKPKIQAITVGDALRSILGRSFTRMTTKEAMKTYFSLKPCFRRKDRCGNRIHSLADIFIEEGEEVIIQVYTEYKNTKN